MLRKKLIGLLVAGLTTTALSAMVVSSASAEFTKTTTECSGGTNVALCYETTAKAKDELEGEQGELVTGNEIKFLVKTSPEQEITCTSSKGSGTIVQLHPLEAGAKTTLHGFLEYAGCALATEPKKKCAVNKENKTVELLGTLESETEIKLEPKSGATFLTITYSNNGSETCPASFAGEHAVTGTQSVEIVEPSVPATEKKGKAIGETLKFFSDAAKLTQELTLAFENTKGEEKLGAKVYVSKVA
jgi:hypothetical protein